MLGPRTSRKSHRRNVCLPFIIGAIPTSSELTTNGFHVYNNGASTGLPSTNNWILASFITANFQILVFPIMDHLGSAYV